MIHNVPMYALGAALVASLAWGGWQWRGKQAALTEAAEAHTEFAQWRTKAAEELAAAQAEARQQEHRHAADMARIQRESVEKAKEAGDAAYNRAVADVRAGRLRGPWACPTVRVPEAGGTAPVSDGESDDRAAAFGRVLRIGAEADQRIRDCQAVIKADRQ